MYLAYPKKFRIPFEVAVSLNDKTEEKSRLSVLGYPGPKFFCPVGHDAAFIVCLILYYSSVLLLGYY